MNDRQLVNAVLSGDESALRTLIAKYERLVAHMVARVINNDLDREELCQDVFIKVHEKLHTFNFDSKLSTWIATIAYRLAVNFAKKKKLDKVDFDSVEFQIEDEQTSFEDEDLSRFVVHLVNQLPVNYKLVLTLFYLEGFRYPEIVEITGMPEGTVKNYLHRAKNKLKIIIEESARKEVELI
ncbi:MAG: RNA polymerase sigma factor [Cyclobacteriaceae bacterium]